MRTWLKARLGPAIKAVDLRDLHCYGGAILAAVGVWQFEPRAAVVALGVFLAWIGVRR